MEGFICSSHKAQRPDDTRLDHWVKTGHDRCCSYCGSWHPDEFLAFLHEAADSQKPQHYITHATKSYKIYIHRPNVSNAGQGAIKFYKWHLPESIDEATQKLYREALETSFRKSMAIVDQTCIDMGMKP